MESQVKKKTVIVGASPDPSRYAYLAAQMLREFGHEFVPVGIKSGVIFGKNILHLSDKPVIENVDTVTLYVGPMHQPAWYDFIKSLKPKRVIFNPGTENDALEKELEHAGIEVEEACTLVMLRTGQY